MQHCHSLNCTVCRFACTVCALQPGPKAWPAGMGLISFFALNVFFQALVQDISTTV
jgi:hypothetical protein